MNESSELAARLQFHVQMLAGEIGERNVYHPVALARAADYIEKVWRDQGYQVNRQTYGVENIPCSNLEISQLGVETPDKIILVGAHYDSVSGSPGANDNGSGIAALLEMARLITGIKAGCTIRFVAFVNEEPPFFFFNKMGSMIYAKAARKRKEDISLMIALETLGYYSDRPGSQHYPPFFRFFYPDSANFVAFVSNYRSRSMLHRFSRSFRRHSSFPSEHVATFSWIPGISWSDHLAFWRQGYRAIMVTDTAFYRYRHYHQPTDLPKELDYPSLAAVTRGLTDALISLANEGVP